MPDQTNINAVLREPIRGDAVEESELRREVRRSIPKQRVDVEGSLHARRISESGASFLYRTRLAIGLFGKCDRSCRFPGNSGGPQWMADFKLSTCWKEIPTV